MIPHAPLHEYGFKHVYPGMRPHDEVIWDEFVKNHREAFVHCAYNVPVGEPYVDSDRAREGRRNGMWGVSQWRVDVLAHDGDREYVIEIKPKAGAGAIGQALLYTKLLQAEGRVSEHAIPVVLTDELGEITQKAAELVGVVVMLP